jgi:5-formyltetrahydrofolate cyclo-ligase
MIDPQHSTDEARWRKTERLRLTHLRQSISVPERRQNSERIMRQLDAYFTPTPETIISLYWPIKGEPNLLAWIKRLYRSGSRVALPVVETTHAPMSFREWTPDAPMHAGIWNIPIPAEGEVLVPTVVIAPVVGFDVANYRLGNGGGYFDRTLAELISKKQRPTVVGVGYECLQIATIYPQPHDIPMDVIITEKSAVKKQR